MRTSSGQGRYLGSPKPSCSTRRMSTQTSRPIKSASVSGPMGCAMPSLKTWSTASGVATPSITANAASLISGISTRLETNPGESLTSTGVLPSLRASSRTAANVASLVARPRTISTSAITGTGLKKCMPITCAGRRVSAPSLVMDMEDVLLARMALPARMRSSARKISAFTSKRSDAASTTNSAPPSASRSMMGVMRASAGSISASCSLPLAASRPRLVRISPSVRSRRRCSTSHSSTRKPARAKTWAIPEPIVPAPTTPTVPISAIANPSRTGV